MSRTYRFGQIEVRPDERRVVDAGEAVALGARAFDLLLALIEHRDRVIGKDELIARVWPDTVVEESNLTVQVSALRKVLGAESISTVPGRGYRFALEPDAPREITPASAGSGAVALALPDKPSIAVLPFLNLSADPEQEFFTDGITEDIIADLSRFHSLFVIARNSSFTYKGKAVDVRTVGSELGVRYVLEGSIRRAASRVRVTAQLIDALDGKSVWAEKYDRILEDIFEVQEQVARAIVVQIAPHIDMAELAKTRQKRPVSLSAYELAVRARGGAEEAYQQADYQRCLAAIAEANAALAIEPDNVIALVALAWCEFQQLVLWTAPDRERAWHNGMASTARAIACDPSASHAYSWRGMLQLYSAPPVRWVEALQYLRRGFELNPNDVGSLAGRAFGEAVSGNPRLGIEYLDQVARSNPRDPWTYMVDNVRAICHFLAKDYRASIACAVASNSAVPGLPQADLFIALSSVGLRDLAGAREALERARRLAPTYMQVRLDDTVSFRYRMQADRDRARTFLRVAAGLEPPEAAEAFR